MAIDTRHFFNRPQHDEADGDSVVLKGRQTPNYIKDDGVVAGGFSDDSFDVAATKAVEDQNETPEEEAARLAEEQDLLENPEKYDTDLETGKSAEDGLKL